MDERPEWHHSAPCAGDERWLVEKYSTTSVKVLRRICASCPVAGECLREAMNMDVVVRTNGVLRVGTNGPIEWRYVDAFVAELAPVTSADWTTAAAWILDGDAAELEVVRRPRRRSLNHRVDGPPRRVETTVGIFPKLKHYDGVAAGQTMTRVEIMAARSA